MIIYIMIFQIQHKRMIMFAYYATFISQKILFIYMV